MATIIWKATYDDYERYLDLCYQLAGLHPDEPDYAILREELQSLPGFPHVPDEQEDIVQPVVAGKDYHFIHREY